MLRARGSMLAELGVGLLVIALLLAVVLGWSSAAGGIHGNAFEGAGSAGNGGSGARDSQEHDKAGGRSDG